MIERKSYATERAFVSWVGISDRKGSVPDSPAGLHRFQPRRFTVRYDIGLGRSVLQGERQLLQGRNRYDSAHERLTFQQPGLLVLLPVITLPNKN